MRHTLKHKAWLLTYMDLCRKNGTIWKIKIREDFEEYTGIKCTLKAFEFSYRDMLFECGLQRPSISRLSEEGTAYIANAKGYVSQDLFHEMNIIRLKWNLEELPDDSFPAQCTWKHHIQRSNRELRSQSILEAVLLPPLPPSRIEQIPPQTEDSALLNTSEGHRQRNTSTAINDMPRALAAPNSGKRKANKMPHHKDQRCKKTSKAESVNDEIAKLCLELAFEILPKHASGAFLEKTKRLLGRNPSSYSSELLKSTQEVINIVEQQQNLINRLVGEQEYQVITQFPKLPSPSSVHRTLARCRQYIVDTVGDDRETPAPQPAAAGYLSRCMEDIANGRIPTEALAPDICNLEMYLESPHSQQALLGALFCRWVFQSPEPMYEMYHSKALMKHFEAIQMQGETMIDGLERVRHADKVVTQQMFVDEQEQLTTIRNRQQQLIQDLITAAQSFIPPLHNVHDARSVENLASDAISLKHTLMLSPMDYRVYYCRPGETFEPSWMQAVSQDNFEINDNTVAGKAVALCLFPALFAQEADPFDIRSSIEDAFVKNKRFFPTSQESRGCSSKECIAKAICLIL